jgi:hypothetical protein
MKLMKIFLLLMFIMASAGTTQVYARRDLDDRHHSDTDNYNWVCPWCEAGPGYNNGMAGYSGYKEMYRKEYGQKHYELEEPVVINLHSYKNSGFDPWNKDKVKNLNIQNNMKENQSTNK